MLNPPEDESTPTVSKIGKYEVIRELGEGGMGVVYAAHDPDLDREVAVKLINRKAANDRVVRVRFRREAKSLADLDHLGIVKVHDWGDHHGQPYIVMEMIQGRSLDERLEETSMLSLTETFSILLQAAYALDHAHGRRILHRDIKPRNIMIRFDGIVKIIDFGIARCETSDRITPLGMVPGTGPFLAPECFGGGGGRSADQWALAVTAFRCLTGRLPFPFDGDSDELTKNICQGPTPNPAAFRPDLPEEAVTALLRALSKRVEGRFDSCSAFIAALGASITNGPYDRFAAPITSSVQPVPNQPHVPSEQGGSSKRRGPDLLLPIPSQAPPSLLAWLSQSPAAMAVAGAVAGAGFAYGVWSLWLRGAG